MQLTERVERADRVVLLDPARRRIRRMDVQHGGAIAQFSESRRNRLLACRCNQREREPLGARVRLVSVQPHRRVAGDLLREQVHLLIRRQRKDVDELNRSTVVRRRGDTPLDQLRADTRHTAGETHQRLGLILRAPHAQPLRQFREHIGVGARFAHRLDHRPDQLQGNRPIRFGNVVMLEKRGGGQHDIREPGGVGIHLLEDHRE